MVSIKQLLWIWEKGGSITWVYIPQLQILYVLRFLEDESGFYLVWCQIYLPPGVPSLTHAQVKTLNLHTGQEPQETEG